MRKTKDLLRLLPALAVLSGLASAGELSSVPSLAAGQRIELQAVGSDRFALVIQAKCEPEKAILWFAYCVVPVELEVTAAGHDHPSQRIKLPNVRLQRFLPNRAFGKQFRDWQPTVFNTADLNFDGHPDLLLSIDVPDGFGDRRAVAFLWGPDGEQYVRSGPISALSETAWLDVNPVAARLVLKVRAPGLMGPNSDTEYQVIAGTPTPTKRTVETVRADSSVTDVVVSEWRDGAWVVTETREDDPPPPAPMAPEIHR